MFEVPEIRRLVLLGIAVLTMVLLLSSMWGAIESLAFDIG